MHKKHLNQKKFIFWVIASALVLSAAMVFAIPALREPVLWRLEQLRVRIRYALNPPEEAVFQPESTVDAMVQATMNALAPTPLSPLPTATPLPPQANTPLPTTAPTALPLGSALSGWTFFSQHGYWNYCAPANLAMSLSYYGWDGALTDIGAYVKPFDRDKNVMPYELAEYVNTQTYFRALVREGGTLELARRLLANGFPVLVEKGVYIKDYSGVVSWMGHYQVLVGYDDATQTFTALDSYFGETDKPTLSVAYADLEKEWRPFNFILLVVYAPEQEDQLRAVLADYTDSVSSYQIAASLASTEIQTLTGQAQFFAAFNYGTSLMRLQDYSGAARAYDEAFELYAALPKEDRPWRMMWYQTGPYFAYYYTGRYQDIVNLADTTISSTDQPYLEENFLWRSRAHYALGDYENAAADVTTCLQYHPDFTPCVEQANLLGVPVTQPTP